MKPLHKITIIILFLSLLFIQCKKEDDLINNEYKAVSAKEFKSIADSIKARKKDSVLNIRINSEDLKMLKQKAKKLGVRYQSFISELIHRVAHS